ncbi:CAP-associated domain-containing protein [Longirhabdus pacifica]|uniref:CAP-associated domain-containing protein n=1 Tax=Longirhabdus pacifica TaxID=2305227 RepID=UPI001008D088|nr:CAP-associated domain-containing protein [Longirhabdus pacifica]
MRFKSILAFTVLLVFTTIFSAQGATFSDIENHWAEDSLEWAADNEIINGYGDGSYRPDQDATEAEFLVLFLRTFGAKLDIAEDAAHWAEFSYQFAAENNYPLLGQNNVSKRDNAMKRINAAELIAAADGQSLKGNEAIQYLLDQGYSKGRTSSTVEGFAGEAHLTRAESVQFIKNVLDSGMEELQSVEASELSSFDMRGIAIGDNLDSVTAQLGQPGFKESSKYEFTWYIYNDDYNRYVQIGIQDDQVVALYSNAKQWNYKNDEITVDSNRNDVQTLFGAPLDGIKKGNTHFNLNHDGTESGIYEIDGNYVIFYYDTFDGYNINAVHIVEKSVEQDLFSFYGSASEALVSSYERQIFEQTNVDRVKRGLDPFIWDERAANTARAHSQDMIDRAFFAHVNPDNQQVWDRMKEDNIAYSIIAENIAYGQTNAADVQNGWMNSEGHRTNILSANTRLGVGTAFKDNVPYFTQNFYKPQKGE